MKKISVVVLAVVAAVLGGLLYQQLTVPAQPKHALLYPTPRALPSFTLTDHHNRVFNNEQLMGTWTLFFIGYTSCPDICPVTLQELNYAYPELQSITQDNIQVAFISADPQRDTVKRLNSYIQYFNKDFLAVRAGHDVLYPFTRSLGLMYAIADDVTKEYYLVNHSASMVLTNPQGQIQAIFKPIQGEEPGSIPSIDSELLVQDFALIYEQTK